MFKKLGLLTVIAFFSAAYAEVTLNVHAALTQNESTKEINKSVTVSENSCVELYRCEGGQLVACISNVTETGATLTLEVKECKGEECALVSNPVVNVIWDEKTVLNIAHDGAELSIEITAQQTQDAQ